MPADVLEVTKNFMRNPIRILVKKEELTLEGIKQFFVLVEKEASKQFILIALKICPGLLAVLILQLPEDIKAVLKC